MQVGLVAADGGLLTSPCTPAPAERAVAKGLANHVVADPLACAKRIAGLPRQAAESTERLCGRARLTSGHADGAGAGS
ncbi:hypothetical protein [Streptomyces xantholiticus]|uniref:Uncharacterized protein n=1 Tax=Streptomyces xantholiticus TaxID=68285 RepID=A0ABV1V3A7_9ACTN